MYDLNVIRFVIPNGKRLFGKRGGRRDKPATDLLFYDSNTQSRKPRRRALFVSNVFIMSPDWPPLATPRTSELVAKAATKFRHFPRTPDKRIVGPFYYYYSRRFPDHQRHARYRNNGFSVTTIGRAAAWYFARSYYRDFIRNSAIVNTLYDNGTPESAPTRCVFNS